MVSAEVRNQFRDRGVELISPATGLRFLEEELRFGRRGEAEVVIAGGSRQPARKSQSQPYFAPLLAGAQSRDNGSEIEFRREFDVSRDLYLNDHRLDGQPVLPLAVATELMAEAASQRYPDLHVSAVRDFRLLHGVVLDRDTKTLRIIVKSQNNGTPRNEGLTTVSVEVMGAEEPRRINYRATIDLARDLPAPPAFRVPALPPSREFSMSIAEIYDRWLFHGPLFQGITALDAMSADGARSVLATCSPEHWIAGIPAASWLIDPLMLDSALQLLVVWAREHWDMTALPTGFSCYRRFAGSAGRRVRCEMRIKPNTGAQTIHADLFFIDVQTGLVVSVLEDMEGACSRMLNRLAQAKQMSVGGAQA
jgi:hypothetical protein